MTEKTYKHLKRRLEIEKTMPYRFSIEGTTYELIKYEKMGKTTGYVIVNESGEAVSREVAQIVLKQAFHLHQLTQYSIHRNKSLGSHDSEIAVRIQSELATIRPEEFSYSIQEDAVSTLAALQIFVEKQLCLDVHLKDFFLILDKVTDQKGVSESDWNYLTDTAITIGQAAYEQIQTLIDSQESIAEVRGWISRKMKQFTKTEAKYMSRFSMLLSELNAKFVFTKVIATADYLTKDITVDETLPIKERLVDFNKQYRKKLENEPILTKETLALLRN
ncbi:hypothetical protein [Brochothrix thermosphacta]|uniref:hypothetical protein n=1 Tax=Brochothrix thermosphacta TaxID=2756 RepID=UPI000D79CE0B|nr:hypothetical protein [Brochothrix thermosphacta]WKK70044.1 hypothetical protein Q0G00_05545 [Brochothrix thermosphacta]SPN76201.1 hypothetical protein BTEBP_50148 [Brochothrix thermosphacta]